ncbi:MAG: SUMF1/EgtB/PvdO family nonheme iron enzyme [Gemmatimonadota bacterium]
MVLVPAGASRLGGGKASTERSACRLFLGHYGIDRHPVTVAAYQRFLEEVEVRGDAAWRHPEQPDRKGHMALEWDRQISGNGELPVTGVDWFDAYAYARWRGRRLPSEAEWEKAALWDGLHGRVREYPWGNQFVPNMANSAESGVGGPVPVGARRGDESPYGIRQACGNVWEWCGDVYTRHPVRCASETSGYVPPVGSVAPSGETPWVCAPRGPVHGEARVLRGGSWMEDSEELRHGCRSRGYPATRSRTVGFRCAWSPPGAGEGQAA